MPSPVKLSKQLIEILAEVKNSEQVKGALTSMREFLTPDNQLQVVKKLVNVPPKDLNLDHMALSAMGDRMYMAYPDLGRNLAPHNDRLGALQEWKDQLAMHPQNNYLENEDEFGEWLSEGGPQNNGMQHIFTGDAVTQHLDNLSIQLPHPLDIFRASARLPANYIQKPWHSTTINPSLLGNDYLGTQAGFRVPGDTPLVFSQGLADKDEVLAPMNDLIKYQFKKKGGLVQACGCKHGA